MLVFKYTSGLDLNELAIASDYYLSVAIEEGSPIIREIALRRMRVHVIKREIRFKVSLKCVDVRWGIRHLTTSRS